MIYYKEAFIPVANIAKLIDESQDYHKAAKSLIYNRKPIVHISEGVFSRVYGEETGLICTFRHFDLFNTSDNCKRLQDGTALILFTPEFCAKLCRDIQAEIPKVLERELCSETTILATALLGMYWYMRLCLQVYKEHKKKYDDVLVFIIRDFGNPDVMYDKAHRNVYHKNERSRANE